MTVSSRDRQGYDRALNRSNRKSQFGLLSGAISDNRAAPADSGAEVVHVPVEQADHANEDEVQRDDVVQQPRHQENEDAGDQRHDRRDRDTHRHGYFLPLEESCMSRPACSTDWPALSNAL